MKEKMSMVKNKWSAKLFTGGPHVKDCMNELKHFDDEMEAGIFGSG